MFRMVGKDQFSTEPNNSLSRIFTLIFSHSCANLFAEYITFIINFFYISEQQMSTKIFAVSSMLVLLIRSLSITNVVASMPPSSSDTFSSSNKTNNNNCSLSSSSDRRNRIATRSLVEQIMSNYSR